MSSSLENSGLSSPLTAGKNWGPMFSLMPKLSLEVQGGVFCIAGAPLLQGVFPGARDPWASLTHLMSFLSLFVSASLVLTSVTVD